MEKETKVLLTDGTYHIIKGHPKDYIHIINGNGVTNYDAVHSKCGRIIGFSEVATMQVNN